MRPRPEQPVLPLILRDLAPLAECKKLNRMDRPISCAETVDEALATTESDLSEYILCHAKPVGLLHVSVSKDSLHTSIEYTGKTQEPLYRAAKEQWK